MNPIDPIVTLSQHSIVTLEYLATAAFAISGVLALNIVCTTIISRARLERSEHRLQAPDTIGLGLFCATGTHLSWITQQLFHDHRPYAICAAAGGASYVLIATAGGAGWLAMTACALVTIGLRALAIHYDFKLPSSGRT